MSAEAHRLICRPAGTQQSKQTARRSRRRHIHQLTHEQQLALIEEARAARRAHAKDTRLESHRP